MRLVRRRLEHALLPRPRLEGLRLGADEFQPVEEAPAAHRHPPGGRRRERLRAPRRAARGAQRRCRRRARPATAVAAMALAATAAAAGRRSNRSEALLPATTLGARSLAAKRAHCLAAPA